MKIFRSSLIYLIFAVLIAAYIFFFERGPSKKEGEEANPKLFTFVADDVQGLVVENIGTTLAAQKRPIELKKDDKGAWQILAPQKFKADESTLRSILGGIADFNPEAKFENPSNLADYGLNSPASKFTLQLKNGSSLILLVGGKNPVGSSTYVKLQDKNTIYLLPSSSVENYLKTKIGDFRNREILKTDTVLARKIRVVHPGKSFTLEKDKENNWNLVEPLKDGAEMTKVRDLLNQVNNLRVDEFVDDHPRDLAAYGLSSPRTVIEVWSSEAGPSKAIYLGKTKTKTTSIFAKDRDLPYVYLVNGYFDKNTDIALKDLRDKSTMKFDADLAKKLMVRHGSQTVTYQKTDKDVWQADGRAKGAEEGSSLVSLFSQLTVSDFAASGAKTGLKNPSFAAEVTLKDATVRKYVFGNREKDKVYLASDKNKDVYLVPSQVVSQMDVYFGAPAAAPAPAAKPASMSPKTASAAPKRTPGKDKK